VPYGPRERRLTGPDEPVPHVVGRPGRVIGACSLSGQGKGPLGDAELALGRPPGQLLNLVPVAVPRRFIHRSVDTGGVIPERLLDGRERFDERRPVGLRSAAEGEHGVGNGPLPLGLALGLNPLNVVEGEAAGAEPMLEPLDSRCLAAAGLERAREREDEGAGEGRPLPGHLGQFVDDLVRVGLGLRDDPLRPGRRRRPVLERPPE
jgi:hypothetical protein